MSERQEQGGAAVSLRGQDEAEVVRALLDSDGEAGILLSNPEFVRAVIARMLIRIVADPESSRRDRMSASSQITSLLGLDKGSKIAEVERQIREVQERLRGEPDTQIVEAELSEKKA